MVMLPVFAMISCTSSESGGDSGTGVGGLIDLRSYESLSMEIELEVPKWNSPPNLEILIDGEAAGYYTRDSKPGKLIDIATVLDLEERLLFTVESSNNDEGREIVIVDSQGKTGTLRAPYAPSASVTAEVDLFGWPYRMGSGYARKAGADGYRHRQWILVDSAGIAMINESKVWNDNRRDAVMATPEFVSRKDEVLLFSLLSVVFGELDTADRDREIQQRALGQLTDEARKDSGFSFDVF